MQLLLTVDQAAAMRAGNDAPASTARLEVTPSDLTALEREVLAAVMWRGHDCTIQGICREGETISSPGINPAQKKPWGGGSPTAPLLLVTPDLDGLRAAIAVLVAARAEYQAEARERQQGRRHQQDAEIERALAAPQSEKKSIILARGGDPATSGYVTGHIYVDLDLPVEPSVYPREDASPEALERYVAVVKSVAARRAELIAGTRDELERLTVAAGCEAAAKKAEHDALYARLPETTRRRDSAGYADSDEILRALRRLMRDDAGYGPHAGWENSSTIDSLDDDEFAALRAAKAEAPDGASVEPMRVWNVTYRPADEDEYAVADEDGEIKVRENERRIAVISWTRGGVECRTGVPLDE